MSEIEIYREPVTPRRSTFEIMPEAIELATHVARTEFVPSSLRGKPEAVVAAILQGHELGLEPMASLNKIHVVDGRPTLAAELMRALVQRAGHEIWLEEASSTRVTMGGRRRGEEHPTRITWTLDDAKRARLDNKNNWRAYPRAMLIARATGELCRLLFADVLAGISYTVEEVRDGFDLDADEDAALAELDQTADSIPGRPEDVAPPPAPTTTRTAPDAATRRADQVGNGSGEASAPKAGTEGRGRRAAPPAPEPPEPELDDLAPAAPKPVEAGDHSAGDTIPGPTPQGERSYTPAQALAIRAGKVGLTDDERHGLIAAYTAGRTSSGKDLSGAEVKAVIGLLDSIEAGELGKPELVDEVWLVKLADGTVELSSDAAEIVDDEATGGPESVGEAPEAPVTAPEAGSGDLGPESDRSGASEASEPESAPAVDVPGSEDELRGFLRGHGIKIAEALRNAAALAGSPDRAPRSLGALVEDRDLVERFVRYVVGEGS